MKSEIMPDLGKSVVSIAIESWRFGKVFERLLTKLDVSERNRYVNQYKWFRKKVEESLQDAGLEIINLEGQPYDVGMAATALNIEDFPVEDDLIIEQMIEPLIMGKKGIVKVATVILKKA